MEIRINKEKNIGNVLFVVEGEKTEFSILRRILCNILGFTYIESRRNSPTKYINNNPNSCVAVINTRSSNIASISDEEYLDDIFKELVEEYNYPIDKAAIYFVFDRDPQSNFCPNTFRNYINLLQNPYENPNSLRAGQLLLSYPSVEAFRISNFRNDSWTIQRGLGSELKEYISENSDIQINKITEDTLKNATFEFYQYVYKYEKHIDIDNFSQLSMKIFNSEEELYEERKLYDLFSMLVLAFMQLGIIEVTEQK